MAIEDFGQKIGGARKDLWSSNGIRIEDLEEFNEAERLHHIKKDNVWKRPNYKKMLNEEGYSRDAVYYIKLLRDSVPTKPEITRFDTATDIREKQDAYVEFLSQFQKDIMGIKEDKDIAVFNMKYLQDGGYVTYMPGTYRSRIVSAESQYDGFLSDKLIQALRMSPTAVKTQATKKKFLADQPKAMEAEFEIMQLGEHLQAERSPYSTTPSMYVRRDIGSGSVYLYPNEMDLQDTSLYEEGKFIITRGNRIFGIADTEEQAKEIVKEKAQERMEALAVGEKSKAKSGRKTALASPILENVERKGPDMHNHSVVGDDFLQNFHIKGGEFGNWLNEAERQANMDMAYDSFKDIAMVLGVSPESISMRNRLNIAFGARGRAGAVAHYEPDREVINLTKMKGAGSLAHEYFHAMDDIAGKEMGGARFATQQITKNNPFYELVQKLKWKEVVVSTEEQDKEHDNYTKRKEEEFKKTVRHYVSDEKLNNNPTLIKEREWVLDRAIKLAHDENIAFTRRNMRTMKIVGVAPELSEISDFLDSHGLTMTKNNERWLATQMESLQFAYTDIEPAKDPVVRRVETDFYKDAKKLDELFSKAGHGYYASDIELAARAFACYISDRLQERGIKNDYLTGHAFQEVEFKDEVIRAYPTKEEREEINKAMDAVIKEMKDRELFEERSVTEAAYSIGNCYVILHATEEGFDYTVMDQGYNFIDGGVIANPNISIEDAIQDVVYNVDPSSTPTELDYDVVAERKEEKERELMEKPALFRDMQIDDKSYKQMTLSDILTDMKTEKEGNKRVTTKTTTRTYDEYER